MLTTPSWPNLNYRELAHWTELAQGVLGSGKNSADSLNVEKVIVPERPNSPSGFVKGEWTLRLTGRRAEWNLTFGIRPRGAFVTLSPGKGPKAAITGTRSPFDLALGKQIRGNRVLGIEALPRERTLILWLSDPGSPPPTRLGLVLSLIPAHPEALLVRAATPSGTDGPWEVLARSRSGQETTGGQFTPPDGSRAPSEMPLRLELVDSLETWHRQVEQALAFEIFEGRKVQAERELRARLKQASERIRQASDQSREADREPDWKDFGVLLKAQLRPEPPLKEAEKGRFTRTVLDFATGEPLALPCDPKLSASAQADRFFQLAKRKERRKREAEERVSQFRERIARLEAALRESPPFPDWRALERCEQEAGIEHQKGPTEKARSSGWLGRSYRSKDGQPIWVGRSKDENLELTFKHARGNDLWLHVRGRPGAHAVVPLHSGKSASLETLLDAATLTVYFSGGQDWGKVEVDYTQKKHVKRIRDSSEASYTHNKTLILEFDPQRLKRLLEQDQPRGA
jgi:predicted ribosome quality control (RQC) complex YloA/Tae2 family protein